MKKWSLLAPAAAAALCLFSSLQTRAAPGQGTPQPALKPVLRFSVPGQEVLAARFSPSGRRLAVVTRAYWPDGHVAEHYPESFFQKLRARAKTEPRFQDPVIHVLDGAGKITCTIRYGWDPDPADDGRVVYAHQERPITGQRILAEPLRGNTIRVQDCRTGSNTVLAKPASGHLSAPAFFDGGKQVIYALSDAVNGAWAGAVGVGSVPAAGGTPTAAYASRKSGKFFHLIAGPLVESGGRTRAVFGVLIPHLESDEEYLAREYDFSLHLHGGPQPKKERALGRTEEGESTALQAFSGGKAMVLRGEWREYDLESGNYAAVRFHNKNAESVYRPDRALVAIPDSPADSGAEPSDVVLRDARTGALRSRYKTGGVASGLTWSEDGTRLAVIVTGADGSDELVVLPVSP